MAKTIDYIALTLTLMLLTFAWSALLFSSIWGAVIFSAAFTAIVVFTVHYILKKRNRPYSPDRLALEFAVRGNEYVIDIIASILKGAYLEKGSNYIELEKCVIISQFKFSSLSPSDMGELCKIAEKHGGKKIYVLTKGVDRRAYSIARLENISFTLVKTKEVFKLLAKHNALPDLKPIRKKPSFRLVIETVLARANFKSYVFSGAMLVLVSFITPLKIYYLIVGSISLLLAILTLTPLGNGNLTSKKIASELDEALSQNNQISIDEILNK